MAGQVSASTMSPLPLREGFGEGFVNGPVRVHQAGRLRPVFPRPHRFIRVCPVDLDVMLDKTCSICIECSLYCFVTYIFAGDVIVNWDARLAHDTSNVDSIKQSRERAYPL